MKHQALKLILEDWLTEKYGKAINFATRKCKEMNIFCGKKIKLRRKMPKEMIKDSSLMLSEKSKRQCLNASIIFTNNWTTVLNQWIK